MRYRYERQGGKLVVTGESAKWKSKAVLALGRGEHRIELSRGESTEGVTMARQEADKSEEAER